MSSQGINKVIIVGNLGQDPEVRFMPNGGAVANFTVATSDKWKDKQTGEQKEKAEWHKIVIYGKLAEISGELLKKGAKVYLEGKLKTRKWQNNEGNDQYTTEVVLEEFGGVMQMLGSRSDNVQPSQQGGYNQGAQQQHNVNANPAQQQYQAPVQQQQQGGYNQQNNMMPSQQLDQKRKAQANQNQQANNQQGGYSQPQSNQQQPNQQQYSQRQQQNGFNQQGQQQQAPPQKINPQEPVIDFDDNIPF